MGSAPPWVLAALVLALLAAPHAGAQALPPYPRVVHGFAHGVEPPVELTAVRFPDGAATGSARVGAVEVQVDCLHVGGVWGTFIHAAGEGDDGQRYYIFVIRSGFVGVFVHNSATAGQPCGVDRFTWLVDHGAVFVVV